MVAMFLIQGLSWIMRQAVSKTALYASASLSLVSMSSLLLVFFKATSHPFVIAFQAATPATLVAGILSVLLAAFSLNRRAILVSVSVLALWCSFLLDLRMSATPQGLKEPGIKVVATNLYMGNKTPGLSVKNALEQSPDVLISVETDLVTKKLIEDSGLSLVAKGALRADGVYIWSSLPASPGRPIVLHERVLPTATISKGGFTFTVVGVHLMSPSTDETLSYWKKDWEMFLPYIKSLPGRAVLLGDFNTSLVHSPMRTALGDLNVASSSSLGTLVTPTWPNQPYKWWKQPLQVLDLDHILMKDLGAKDFERFELPGSDHLGVAAVVGPLASKD